VYASITNIKWNYDQCDPNKISGCTGLLFHDTGSPRPDPQSPWLLVTGVMLPEQKEIREFEVEHEHLTEFEIADQLWNLIDPV
jgi:hypothetical protein